MRLKQAIASVIQLFARDQFEQKKDKKKLDNINF